MHALHYSGIVEHDVYTSPRVEMVDHRFNVGLFRNVTFDRFESRRVWNGRSDFFHSLFEGRLGNVGHEDRSTLASEEDSCFEAYSADGKLDRQCLPY